ncbi:hypothetical protein C0431_13230 [bacterium]|nr:hypothetical protein [bacterium]
MAIVLAVDGKPQFRRKQGIMPDFSGSAQASQELPSGIIDGINQIFKLKNLPIVKSEVVYKNGILMVRGVDYMITGDTITFANDQVPQLSSRVSVDYRYAKVV